MCWKLAILKDLVVIRYLAILLLLAGPVLADEPSPTDDLSVIVASSGVSGTGKRSDPYVFDTSTKCALRLTGKSAAVKWDLEDCPTDTEAIDRVLIFSLAQPGTYVVWVQCDNTTAKAWFEVRSGAGPPPTPQNTITTRVKTSLAGQPKDAATFGVVCEELAKALDAGTIVKQSNFESSMQAALTSVSWQVGKYADLSKLTGELFDRGDKDWTLTAEDKATFAKHLRTIAEACKGIK